MATDTKTGVTQVYEVYIKATPQAIWDAITTPEWTVKYGYKGATTLRPSTRRCLQGARHARHAQVRPA